MHTVTNKVITYDADTPERSALYLNRDDGDTYMMAQVSTHEYALISISAGQRYSDATSGDPFNGKRGIFDRLPGNRKITIE